ncbi:MAG: hypothetical protein JWM68_5378 [Verrucomicrobiales bacterium]|nr:hypothetical protein [Verrucomicrobiales bacterium]
MSDQLKKRVGKIKDKFTGMKKGDGTPMSRQQIHMLRKRARGICWICSEPAIPDGYFCLRHQIAARERMRKKLGCKKRYKGSESYVLKAQQKPTKKKKKTR